MLKKKFPSLASIGSDGNTAFLRAARAGHLDKVLEQLKSNVDINTSNANGLNALHLASKDGHINVVSELLKRGAKVDSATKKGNTALHIASLAGQEEVVKHLVEHGASVNVQSQNGFTPLYMAAQENHDAVVRFLLANGANQSLATEDGFTPLAVAMQQGHDKVVAVLLENDTRGKVRLPALHIAAKKDDCKAAALLLQNEHNPDVTSKSGFTPLHIASHYGNEAIANLLLSKGADVNYAAKHNITPLHVAAKWGKANMVSVLLSRGANIEAKTRDGLTPLHCAARSGHEQVVDMLLERGAPISAKTKNGLAALHMSSQGDHVDAARILLYHRAPVDDVTVDYLTALHVAAHCGHVGVARLLLDRKADPNARALNGFTPLHIACKKNRIKVVELLLKHGASIEATTESGLTPLHVASFMGCMNIVIYLVQNEAGPDVKTVRGETPLHLAARANQTDIIRILLRNGAQVDARAREQQTPLHIASRLGNVDIVMLLLQHGASVDSTTKDLYTALHIAAKEGQDEVASVLLENGASLEATTKKGFTPLHLAAKYGHMNVAKLLLRRDAPVDAQGKNGVTPLHVASHYDHQNVALLLLEKGASPHATAKNGHTPLHIAARKNQMDIATTLLEYGAKANAESKAGFTPLHLSAQEGHSDMSNLLIEHQADVNHKAKNGLTPLHLCSQEDRVEVGGILLKNESEVNSTTKAGYTPLHVACHFGQMGMVRLLLANGASVTPTTAVNYTPLHQAAQQGHAVIVNELLAAGADPNATTNQGQTAMSIAQKLGYISVMETLKGVTHSPISPTSTDEKYKVVSPETMQETFMSDSEDEGGEDTMLSEQPYHYLTVDEMKGLGDDSLPIDVTRDERDNRDMGPPTAIDDTISPQHMKESYTTFAATDNVDINRHPLHVGFLVSFLVDARGGAMRGVRHSGVRVIVPPRRASMPLRVTCRYLKRDKLPHPPPLMEGEALASRILELGPVGAKFLGPVMIEVPHFGSLRGKEREIVILRSDNGETWREHTFEASEEAVHDVLSSSFEKDELSQYEESPRMTRILTTEFPHYIAVVSRVRQEVHAIGPEGGMVSSTVVPQVQAVFPHGALTKKIKVGLQAQPIPADLTAKLLGNRVAVSPIVTVEPRRRKFHKPISLTIPVPQAANKGMINQYSGDAPTLRLLCSITGGTTRAQWEDVTGSTPLTFVNDCVSFTTTVSARFWLMDCRNITEATKMATELYKEAIHVPFMAKFVVFAKRVDTTEARLRVFCMTDDKEDKTLEHQEHFIEVAKSRDVEVMEGKTQYLEFAGNLVPVTKSGEQLQLGFRAFKENRLPFTVRVKDPHADAIGRTIFMREPKVAKGDVPQQPICILNIVLPEEIIPEPDLPEHEAHKHSYITHTSGLQRLSDISNLLGEDWVRLAGELGVSTSEVNSIKTELCESSVTHQGLAMLRLWLQNAGNKASASALEQGLRNIGRDDIIQQTVFQTGTYALSEELSPSYTTKQGVFKRIPGEKRDIIEERRIEERIPKDEGRDSSIGERVPQIEERIPKKEERRMTIDKDDGTEKKYEAEEKAVEEESLKSVSERKKEIEKRLSQDVEDKTTKEKVITKEIKITTKETKTSKETIVTRETTSTEDTTSKEVKKEKSKKLLDDATEKETAEEKAVSPEPAHLSFDEKRKSFEMGITPKEKVKQQDSLTDAVKPQEAATAAFIAEESRVNVQEVTKETISKKEEKEEEEEKEMSFAEKRRSFEQGLSMKQPGDKLPAAERKKEAATDRKAEEEKRVSDFRRDSELFQEVSQGLDNIEKGIVKPAAQELLSPGVARTPPPSPADFTKDAPDNKKWSVEAASNLLSGQDGKPRGADKSKEAVESSWLSQRGGESVDGGMRHNAGGGLRSPYDNVNGIYYKEMADESVYPPQLGYAEFESPDALGSTSSLTQEHGTDTFSELLFSSSNSESEEPDDNFPISREYETYGILYDMSSHISKVPEMFARRTEAARVDAAARPNSPQDLESRLKYYHDLCNRSLSPEIHGVSPAERAELKELEESISQMLIDIRREESLFYSDNTEGATNTIKRRPKPKKDTLDEKFKETDDDGETALKEIESHIFQLLQDVEQEEREVMGSLRRDFRKSTEKLEESVPSPWDMINATTSNEDNQDVSYVRFRESSCTPSPIESSSTSEDEYDFVPRVELNIGSRLGRSTIDISVKNSPAPKRKSVKMSASKRSLNRSLPSLKSSSMSLVWKDHNSSECLLESPRIWQTSSVEYISPPERIDPGSGYCIWSYPSEDENGQDQVAEGTRKTPVQETKSKEPQKYQKNNDKGKRDDAKKEPMKKNEKPSLDRKDSAKRVTPDKTQDSSKKVSPDKTPESSKKVSPDKTPESSKKVSPDKTPESSKKVSPDKTPESSKKVSPDKTPESSKKVSPDKTPESSKKVSPDKTPESSKKVSPDKTPESSKKISPDKTPESSKKISPVKTPESTKKISPVKTERKPLERRDSKKTPSPEKSVTIIKEKTTVTKVNSTEESTTASTDKVTIKSQKSQEVTDGKLVETDSSKQKSTEKTKMESTKSETNVKEKIIETTEDKGKGKQKKGRNGDPGGAKEDQKKVEEKITKQVAETGKGPATEKKSSILGKTIETIKKPFQDKGAAKGEKGKGKGKEKGKQKSIDSTKSLSQEIDEPREDQEQQPSNVGEKFKIETDTIEHKTVESIREVTSESSKTIQEPKEEKIVVEKSVGIISDVSDDRSKGGQQEDKSKGKGKNKGTVSEPPKTISLSRTVSQEQEKSIKDTKDGETPLKDNDKEKDGGSPKETKGKGKGKDKSDSPKAELVEIVVGKKGKTDVEQTSPQIDQSTEDQKKGANEDPSKDVDGKRKGKVEPVKQQSADRASVVEPLIEKTVQDIAVIAVGSVDKGGEEKAKKEYQGSPKDNKNKGKGKNKSGLAKTPSSEDQQKSDSTVVGKAVDMIKKPFQGQTKPVEDTKATQKTGKSKKQKSVESPMSPLSDNEAAKEQTELANQSKSETTVEEKTGKPGNGESDKKVDKSSVKDDTKKLKEKGKQKSVESNKSPSPEKHKIAQNLPKVESTPKEQIKEQKSPEPSKKEDKKKGKGKQKSIESSKTSSFEKEEGSVQQVSTSEPTLIEKTLETIKRPFQGKKDDKTASKQGQEADAKKGNGKSKQKSVETTRQSSTEHERKGETIITTETVRLIKELSQDKSGHVIEESGVDLVTKPFGDKSPLLKSNESSTPTEESKTAILIKELSQDKSGQKIEETAIELVSKPFEHKDGKTLPSGEKITTRTETLTKQLSQEKTGQVIEEKGIDLVSQPLQKGLGTQKQSGETPTGKKGTIVSTPITELSLDQSGQLIGETTTKLVSEPLKQKDNKTLPLGETITTTILTKELSHDKSGHAIEEKEIDLVTKPLQEMLGAHSPDEARITVAEPRITEISQEKSDFIIEQRPIDLVSRPFQGIPETSLASAPVPHKDNTGLPDTQGKETASITGPLIRELSHEKSGFIIEERPIDLVSQPFQDILPSSSHSLSKGEITESTKLIEKLLHDKSGHIIEKKPIDLIAKPLLDTLSKTQGEEKSIRELSHEKSGFIIEERPIDLVSQPFQNILETSLASAPVPHRDNTGLPNTQGKETASITGPLIRELSHEKSGFIIEESPIDLVSQPFQDILPSSSHSLSKGEITESTKLIEKLSHDKSGHIIEEKPIDLIAKPLLDTFSKTQGEDKSTITGPLIRDLSHEKSGFIIEERPIDLVSQPFQDILETSLASTPLPHEDNRALPDTQGKETASTTGPLIEELSHEKSGFIIEESPIDLVSQPFQGILETSKSTEHHPSGKEGNITAAMLLEERSHSSAVDDVTKSFQETKELPPSSLEGSKRAVLLVKELSQDKSGQVIEGGAIDLVAKPFLETIGRKDNGPKTKKKESKSRTVESKKGDECSAEKNDFEHIQKTIDDAKNQFDQFVGIVSEKAAKSSNDKTNEKMSSSTSITSTTISPFDNKEGEQLQPVEQEVEIPVEKEEDLLRIQRSIQRGFQSIPSETIGTVDVKTVTTTVTKPVQEGMDNVSIQAENVSAVEKDVKKVMKTVTKSVDGGITVIERTIESQMKPVKDESKTLVEKTIVTVEENLPKIDDYLLNFGKVLTDKGKDLPKVEESVKQQLQNMPSQITGKIDVRTVTSTITKPIEEGAENVSIQAENVINAIDKDVKKGAETVTKSVAGGVTVIEKTVESQVTPVKDGSKTLVKKTVVTIQENLPKMDDSRLNFGNTLVGKEKHLPKIEETIQQQLQNIPSEITGEIDLKTIRTTVTSSVEQGAENISFQAEEVVGAIDKKVKKVTESVNKSVDGGVTVVEETIESQVKPVKDASRKVAEKTVGTLQDPLSPFKGLGIMAHESVDTIGKSQIMSKSDVKDLEKAEAAIGKVTHTLETRETKQPPDVESSESFLPELRAQSVKIATFETVETILPTGTGKDGKTTVLSEVTVTGSSNDEIGRIIKEMESQLLSTKFGMDESTVDDGSEVESEDYTRESRTMPTIPKPARKMFGDVEAVSDSEGGAKPYVTTPTLSRRVIGVGGSQRLSQGERPVVRVITEYVGDLSESEPEEDTYTVLEPEVKERRKFKIRFSPDMYGSEDKDEFEGVQGPDVATIDTASEALKRSDSIKSEKNIKRIERKFERMTSQTKEADPSMSEVTDGEFQKMVSQLSLEEMDQALHQWDAGGLTPSEVDSKDLTLSSDDTTSPLQQEGSHTLEPGETGETPPIPSPRTPLKPTDSQDNIQDQTQQDQTQTHAIDDDESKNYATRKMFWEQMSSGSVESPPTIQDVTPPVPKPRVRLSISQSIDLPEEKKAVSHSEASTNQEVSEIGVSDKVLHGVTTTESVARDSTTEREISLDADTNSEMEFIKSHDIEELSYDNDAFDDDTSKDFPFPETKQRKGIFERSVSLPGDTTIDISNNVRSKKRIFEAQIKKEMVVEQLMSQMEEDGSPEHKAFETTTEPTDQAAMLNRQIHSEIVSHELEEQIESNILENKALVQNTTEIQSEQKRKATTEVSPVKTEDDASESDKTNDTSSELPSIYETKISSTVAEVLHYKNDAISKPSDSLEVHVDKSELEDTEKVKEIEEEWRVIDEKYETRQMTGSDQAKSSITSSQGESEDTFSESDVTPEDARFKDQHDIHVWGPSDKDLKLAVDQIHEQKKQRSVHTPEEHIPDTVWEVPVQESTETLEVETVGQLPSAVTSWQENEALTESEARKIAEIFVEDIESELINTEASAVDTINNEKGCSKMKTPEKTPATKKPDNILKLSRTDTTTSSMEITDEDLRSSGMTNNSPLESQIGQGLHMSGQHDVFGEDSGDDVDAQELDRDTIGKEDVEKTLAEVKQSLEAVKEELIEEKKKKRDSITKESPSEFEFKALVLEKTFSESIQEHHQEEATTIESKMKTSEGSEVSQVEKTFSSFEQTLTYESDTKTLLTSEKTAKEQEASQTTYDGISKKDEIKYEEHKTSTVDITYATLYTSTDHDILKDQIVEPKEVKTPGSTTGSEVSIKSTKSQDTVIEKEGIEKQKPSTMPLGGTERTEKVLLKEDIKDEFSSQIKTTTVLTETSSRPDLDFMSDPPVGPEERKSPLDDVFSNSSSSDYKGGSNDASTLDKPNIVIRKHKKSSLAAKDPKSDGEHYSSSGSHYESFEQTSESIKSPGSRPLSSDIEGLVAAAAGMTTGSSEYESAVSHEISGQSTTITSREYQTAVSSLSSRDSMKSLDSESSGNLASIEVSSEASETLVPSAMELEKDSEEPVIKQQNVPPFTVENQVKMQSFSESIEQSVSFDISGEDISEDDDVNQVQPDHEQAIRMKRSHEMTFQPEPRPIVLEGELSQGQDEKFTSSLDDMSSLVSTTTDSGANRTVIELSKTESERMDGSATSEQLSLTVSGTSDLMSLSESREFEERTVLSRTETIATQSPPFQQSAGGLESVTITTSSIVEQGIQSVCTQVTSKVELRDASHSNGPTQVEYNAEYDEGDHEVKKRGHRRNGSTSFRPSMIPVFQARDTKKKSEDLIEDSAESDKYTQPLTVKEGTQEEKKDVDETERLEEEFYKTEADQAMNRDLREGRISIADTSYGEGAKSFDSSLGHKSRLHSAAFSDDHPDSEIAELLKQCSSDIPSEDPIERPKTPEPVEECELKDDTPEFSSEAQASVTELEMEYSGAFSRSAEYAAHVSPIREKGLPEHESWEHLSEGEQTMDDSVLHSPDPLHLGFEDSASEKHELETHESTSKEKLLDRSKSPVPDITVTQHMHPTPQDSFENIEMESDKPPETSNQTKVDGVTSDETDSVKKSSESKGISDDLGDRKDDDSASDSPTSDSFELLEKPDLADEFVIIEEVGREASEQDTEGKSVKIDMKRVTSKVGSSSAPTVVSPPPTVTKMTQVKYFTSGATEEEIPFDFDSGSPAKSAKSEKESSQEGSPPSAEEPDFKPDLEASKKWMEMQFQGAEPIAQIYGYDMEYERGPLEDIKEEDINDLEGSSRIGSMGSQVSQSIGSFGSVKESLSSTPDYDVLAGRKFFTRSGEHDDVSMSSLQEFERLEHLIALESSKHKSSGSQDSLTSSSNNSRKHGSRSGGDDISLASLKEFEGLENACIAAEGIEKKAKAEEESLLSEIEEGHESQASESESCATISVGGMQRGESDEDDYEKRMFEIDEIIRQAQTNVEQFMDSKNRETLEGGLKSETLGRADSLEEISKVPELDLDQPMYSVSYSSGKSYIQQWEDLGDDLVTSTDSLELKTQKSKTSVIDPFTTSTDSLDVKISQDVMSVSTDSIEASQKAKKKDIMTDSIEVGEKTSMLTSVDSLDGKVTQANSIDEDEHHAMGTYDQSSSSGKEGDLSSSGKDDSAEGAVGMNRMPPPRAEYLLGSTDSLEPTSSTATHATYHYETDSVMSSSFTSGDSTTMVDDNDEEGAARASMWFDEGKPYVTEVIEPIIGDEEFSHVIHRKVEMPPEIHKVSFKGMEAEHALREYIEKFDPGEDCTETREVDEHGNVHVKRVIQKRVIVRPEELGGDTTDLSGPELEKYLQTLTQTQMETEPFIDTIHSSSDSHSTVTTTLRTTTTLSQGDSIKTEQEQKQTVETHRRGSRPPLKYDISVDEEPEFDPREHDWRFNLHTHIERDEESQEGAYGFSETKAKGAKK